jgi:hypothetical protein
MSDELNQNEQQFDIGSLNESLGEGFSFEDLGSLKETLSKVNELSTQSESFAQEKSEWDNKYKELDSKYNSVLSHFTGDDVIEKLYGSKNTWERVQLEKKFADKDPNVVSTIYNSDIDSLRDEDVILLADKLSVKADLPDSDRKQAILEDLLGQDVDLSELNPTQRYKLSKAASQARTELSSVKNFKPDEPTFDWLNEAKERQTSLAEKQNKAKEAWSKIASENLPKYEGTKVYDGEGDEKKEVFSYKPDDAFREKMMSTMVDTFTNSGYEVNEETMGLFNDFVNQQHILANFPKMIKAAMASAKTSTEDELHDEIHSDTKKNDTQAPPIDKSKGMSIMEYRKSKNK